MRRHEPLVQLLSWRVPEGPCALLRRTSTCPSRLLSRLPFPRILFLILNEEQASVWRFTMMGEGMSCRRENTQQSSRDVRSTRWRGERPETVSQNTQIHSLLFFTIFCREEGERHEETTRGRVVCTLRFLESASSVNLLLIL